MAFVAITLHRTVSSQSFHVTVPTARYGRVAFPAPNTLAIVILSAMVVATYSGVGLADDMNRGMFDNVLVSSTHCGAIFLGKVLADIVRIITEARKILVLGYIN